MISAISSQGSVRFMVYQDTMNQQRLIRFMERLMRTSDMRRLQHHPSAVSSFFLHPLFSYLCPQK